MDSDRHRAPRVLFAALIDLTDMQSGRHLAALTKNLSLSGCSVKTMTPFPEGAKVRLRIWHSGLNFISMGRVVYSRPSSRMGIVFTAMLPGSQPVLEGWLANLRRLNRSADVAPR